MNTGNKSLGKQLKQYRLSRLMTQGRMAILLGISRQTYIKVEAGRGCSDLVRAKITENLVQQVKAA